MTYIQPLLSLLILAFAGAAYRAWRRPHGGRPVLLTLATFGLFIVTWLPLARMIERPFDNYYLAHALPPGGAQAIVIVSGGMEGPNPVTHQRRTGEDTYARCLYAAWLYQHGRQAPILTSGGPSRARPLETPDAMVMRTVLEGAGVPAQMIWCEARSHSTHENAVYSAAILRQKHIQKIILVTSVFQMLRASLCFRKEGLTVLPAACDYRTYAPYTIKDYFPCWKALQINEDFLHETMGLAWYWARGWVA
ncbi:MAG: YdcF family protein [Terriglobia bacterium]